MTDLFHIRRRQKTKLPFGQACFVRDFGEKTSLSLDLGDDVAQFIAARVESGTLNRYTDEKRYVARFVDGRSLDSEDATARNYAEWIAKDTEKNRQLILEVNQAIEAMREPIEKIMILQKKKQQIYAQIEWFTDEELCAVESPLGGQKDCPEM